MLRTRCPNCRKPVQVESLSSDPAFPFCSLRCRLADLDHWFEEEYVVPGDAPGEEPAGD